MSINLERVALLQGGFLFSTYNTSSLFLRRPMRLIGRLRRHEKNRSETQVV